MKQDRTESFASPLDEVLENIPQEDPPQDLEQRCLDALGGSAAQAPSHPNWWLPVRNVIAVAAGLVLVVGAVSLMGPHMMPMEAAYEEPMAEDAMVAEAPPPPSAPGMPGTEMAQEPADASALRDELSADNEVAGREFRSGTRYSEPVPAGGMVAEMSAPEPAPRGDAGDVIAGGARIPAQGATQAPEVEDPWRDFSGDRQVITNKELDLEVGDVEEAYDSAQSIVQKHGGFIASDRVQIAEDQADVAHLTIRVPVGNFESAITDLRQLGEVTRLVGQSVDVTEQYYEEGAEIREKADREQWLMDRLENARTEREKQQLRHQINQLRAEMKQEKAILSTLAEQTHWPVLELTLTEASSPGEFLSRTLGGSLKALAWVGATAIIWVPLVVLLTLFWRRLTPRAPAE